MNSNRIVLKGNKDVLNIIVDMNKFKDFDDVLDSLKDKMSGAKSFYKDASIIITIQLKYITDRQRRKLKDLLFDEFFIKDCSYQELELEESKAFEGVFEGRTKYITTTIRSGQVINYHGNLVIIGDVNPGAEIYADGNIIVLGHVKGDLYAGVSGNTNAIIAAYKLEPKILKIATLATLSPDGEYEPQYPEIATIKGHSIIVEPYIPNKFI